MSNYARLDLEGLPAGVCCWFGAFDDTNVPGQCVGLWDYFFVGETVRVQILFLLIVLVIACGGCRPNTNGSFVSGTIETDEAHLASRYGGRVEKILAQEGEHLTNGQVIVELEAAELRARRERLVAFCAELEAGPRKEEIAVAKAEWEAQLAQLEYARAEARRATELFEKKTISAAEYELANSRATALEKSAAAAKSKYELLLAGTRAEQIAQARAQLVELDAQLREMQIVAPTNCVLEVLHVRLGDVLAPNREVATVVFPDQTYVRVYLPEPWLGWVKVGDKVQIRVDAFPEREFEGVVEFIGRIAEFTPRNVQTIEERIKQVFPVKVRLNNPNGELRAGMAADVFFTNIPNRLDKHVNQTRHAKF